MSFSASADIPFPSIQVISPSRKTYESGAAAIAIAAAAAARSQLMLNLFAPCQIASCDEVREAPHPAAGAALRIEACGHCADRRPQILLEALDLRDAPELVDADHLFVQPHHL